MTDERVSTPSGWTEADYDSDRTDRQVKQPAVFEHESGDLAVFVRSGDPADPGDASSWQVEVGPGGRENLADADAVNVGISDRASAIGQAKEIMDQILREGVPASTTNVDWKSRLQ